MVDTTDARHPTRILPTVRIPRNACFTGADADLTWCGCSSLCRRADARLGNQRARWSFRYGGRAGCNHRSSKRV